MATPLGCRIKELRRAKGLSQVRLALEMDENQYTIARWESGLRCPSIHKLPRLAMVLDTTVDYLLSGAERTAC